MGVAFMRLDENNDIVDPHGVLACECITSYEKLVFLFLDRSGGISRTLLSVQAEDNHKCRGRCTES